MTSSSEEQATGIYLTDTSPKDKQWDCHRHETDLVRDLLKGTEHARLAERMNKCSNLLLFLQSDAPDAAKKLTLSRASFCRVRTCPVCQWRRSLMWQARFLGAIPALQRDYPTARYIFLTLTVENCEIEQLKATIKSMTEGWKRLTLRKDFPAIGFIKSLEITRGKDGTAHPHYHVLMMVPNSYFNGKNYMPQKVWRLLWKDSMRLSYDPVVDVRAVKPNKNRPESEALPSAIVETMKYSIKPADLIADQRWLTELLTQIHKTRSISIGGKFREYIKDDEPEDLIGEAEKFDEILTSSITFIWREPSARYVKLGQ